MLHRIIGTERLVGLVSRIAPTMRTGRTPVGAWRAVLAQDTGKSGGLADLEREWLARQGVPVGSLDDMWRYFAASKGYSSSEDGVRAFAEGGAVSSIAATHLTTNGNNADQTSYTTASITPTANRLVLLWTVFTAASPPAEPTVTGNDLTWVSAATIVINNRRMSLFRALGATPSAGVVTLDFGATTITGIEWSVSEFSGIDTGGSNGANAVVQAPTGANTGLVDISTTLAPFGNSRNATAVAVTCSLNEAMSLTNTTLLGAKSQAAPPQSIISGFTSSSLTTAGGSWTNTGTGVVIAAELKAA